MTTKATPPPWARMRAMQQPPQASGQGAALQVHPFSPTHVLLRSSEEVDGAVLKLYGARWQKKSKGWIYPRRMADLELLRAAGLRLGVVPDLGEELTRADRLDSYLAEAEDLQKQAQHAKWQTIDGHQRVGVGFLVSRPRALLAFAPGLGKSATAVIAADLVKARRILVLAPLTLGPTWEHEIRTWSQDPGEISADPEAGARWTVTNPEKLVKRRKTKDDPYPADPLQQEAYQAWDLVIADESVLYKERASRRTSGLATLLQRTPTLRHAWLLSGSPITRYADDLWAQLNILRPEWFTGYWRFAGQWTHLAATAWGTKIVGNRDPQGLRWHLRDLVLSRTPREVPVLPKAPIERLHVQLGERQLRALAEVRDQFRLGDENIPNVLVQLTRLGQLTSYPRQLEVDDIGGKMRTLREMLQWVPKPLVVWAHYRETLEGIQKEIRWPTQERVEAIHGGTSEAARKAILADYAADKVDVLLLQIQTGKFGLSLTNTKTVVCFDRSYALDDWVQMIARVRRRSSPEPVPTYVLDAGWADQLINVMLKRKLRSVADLKLSDLLEQLQ